MGGLTKPRPTSGRGGEVLRDQSADGTILGVLPAPRPSRPVFPHRSSIVSRSPADGAKDRSARCSRGAELRDASRVSTQVLPQRRCDVRCRSVTTLACRCGHGADRGRHFALRPNMCFFFGINKRPGPRHARGPEEGRPASSCVLGNQRRSSAWKCANRAASLSLRVQATPV